MELQQCRPNAHVPDTQSLGKVKDVRRWHKSSASRVTAVFQLLQMPAALMQSPLLWPATAPCLQELAELRFCDVGPRQNCRAQCPPCLELRRSHGKPAATAALQLSPSTAELSGTFAVKRKEMGSGWRRV